MKPLKRGATVFSAVFLAIVILANELPLQWLLSIARAGYVRLERGFLGKNAPLE